MNLNFPKLEKSLIYRGYLKHRAKKYEMPKELAGENKLAIIAKLKMK